MKILSIVGARPQFIKAAAVWRALGERSGVEPRLIHTGQHYDDNMSAIFFRELGLPEADLNLGIGSDSHGAQTGRMLIAIEKALIDERPDWVIVYGDTNSTLAGALAASKLHLPLAHVEAGLRSFDRRMPEEINRVLTDQVSDRLFAPTETAVANLEREGIDSARISLVGDVMYDSALYYLEKSSQRASPAEALGLQPGEYLLATVHRAENTDEPEYLARIFKALQEVAATLPVVVPLHPRTRKLLARAAILDEASRSLILIEPQGYLDMIRLEQEARIIVTDSGGIQKEAFFTRVPCVTLREQTEWTELIDLGWNRLAPPSGDLPIEEVILNAIAERARPAEEDAAHRLYGGGHAAEEIVRKLCESPG